MWRILYGSQTGTAADVADRIGRILQRIHVKHDVLAMDEFGDAVPFQPVLVTFYFLVERAYP